MVGVSHAIAFHSAAGSDPALCFRVGGVLWDWGVCGGGVFGVSWIWEWGVGVFSLQGDGVEGRVQMFCVRWEAIQSLFEVWWERQKAWRGRGGQGWFGVEGGGIEQGGRLFLGDVVSSVLVVSGFWAARCVQMFCVQRIGILLFGGRVERCWGGLRVLSRFGQWFADLFAVSGVGDARCVQMHGVRWTAIFAMRFM